MVYITSEGTVSDTKKRKWGLSLLLDWIGAVFEFIGIFFRTLTTSQSALENERGRRHTTYAQRQGIRRTSGIGSGSGGGSSTSGGGGGGSNIRRINQLGCANNPAGG